MATVQDSSQAGARSSGSRVYRFDALDRGIVGRLGRTQLVVLAACGMVGFTSVLSHRYVPVAVVILAVGVAVTVPEAGGMPVVGWLPVWARWFISGRRHRRWYRPLHLTTAGLHVDQPSLPTWLGGLRLISHPTDAYGVVHDTEAGAMTVVVPVAGRGFTTHTDAQREFLVEGWGRVFAAFAEQAGVAVARICWSDIARPTPLDAHAEWVTRQTGANTALAGDYLAHLAPLSVVRHDLVVAVTVHVGNPGNDSDHRRAFDAVDTALKVAHAALGDAGLACSPAASVEEIAWLTRTGLDPTGLPPADGPVVGSLVQRLGLVPAGEAGPMATETFRDRVEIDTVAHRSFWIAGWPEADQNAGWFEPLLTHTEPGVIQRIVTIVIEPIPDARATAEINIDISRHGANAAAAHHGATRITARNQRKADAAHAREHEVAAGYHPVAYAGLLTLTTPTADDLERVSAGFANRFARSRTTLRPLAMRMDIALAASLPLGLGLSRTEPD